MAIFIKKNNQLQPVGSMGNTVEVADTSLAKSIVDRSVTSVTAEDLDGITSIGSYAFYFCQSLTNIGIPDSVGVISQGAFCYCIHLESITIPNSVSNIDDRAFEYCSGLTSVTIGNDVRRIGESAFSDCSSLTNITIPDSVTSINYRAFDGCTSLTEIHFHRSTPATVANINAWNNIPTTCKIYVPTGSLSAYKSAPNYPDPSTYQYIEE